MPYTYNIYDTIDEVDEADWTRLCREGDDAFMDPRFIRVMERSMSHCAKFRHVIFRDDCQKSIASACLYTYRLDVSHLCSGRIKKFVARLGRIAPWLTHRRLVLCGLPLGAGQSNLRLSPDADEAEVLKTLDEILKTIASQDGAVAILFREFTAKDCERLRPLQDLGYSQEMSFPMNYTHPDFRDLDDYCQHIKAHKRRIIKRSREKFAQSGLRVVHRTGCQALAGLYTDDVHKLFETVVDGKPTFELLTADFFRGLAQQMGEEVIFTTVENKERIVAFAASLYTKIRYHQLFVGYDSDLNSQCDLYFNLWFHVLDDALKRNVCKIILGQTCDTFKKQKLGACQEPQYFYRKGLTWFASLLLQVASGEINKMASDL
jgi:predicted N-acyltransferase